MLGFGRDSLGKLQRDTVRFAKADSALALAQAGSPDYAPTVLYRAKANYYAYAPQEAVTNGKAREHFEKFISMPLLEAVELPPYENLKTEFFLKRRELGVINVGGAGSVTVDGEPYALNTLDGLYVGQGSQSVQFRSDDPATPARFFLMSAPAHHAYPTAKLAKEDANPTRLGARETANERTIYKYIHGRPRGRPP